MISSCFKRVFSTFNHRNVTVAMSGGVDSGVSAALLQKQGYNVKGIYMRNWDTKDENGVCTSEKDWQDVQKTCAILGIECEHVDFVKEYWNNVFQKTIEDYAHGLTPNPDIACNSFIKFGALLDKIPPDVWLATGHYCQATLDGRLLRGTDRKKDQSYYLSTVPEEALRRTLFPLGQLRSKVETKDLAHSFGLGFLTEKKESMGICFVGQKRRFGKFLQEYIDQPPGPAVDLDGNLIGTHEGLYAYTIGQASRISHGSSKWVVAQKLTEENTLVVAPGTNHPSLFHYECTARDWVWINHKPPSSFTGEMIVDAQVRYRQSPEKAMLSFKDGQYHVRFLNDPVRAIVAGQQVVVWDNDWCLGGGVIDKVC
ncbi:tRNA methyl transferase [Sporodiniella umbellata]|nr:tRNA methyl transferase [Sporodiniella umbellata]